MKLWIGTFCSFIRWFIYKKWLFNQEIYQLWKWSLVAEAEVWQEVASMSNFVIIQILFEPRMMLSLEVTCLIVTRLL